MEQETCAHSVGKESDLKNLDHFRHYFNELGKRSKNELTLIRQSVIERYRHHSLTVICDLDITVPNAAVGHDVRRGEEPAGDFKFLASAVYCSNADDVRKVHMSQQEFMLVDNVESVQGPDGFSIPSLVRLYCIHDDLDSLFAGLIFKSAFNGVFKAISGVVDRELSKSIWDENGVMHSVVECGSEVVNSIPDNEGDRVRNAVTGDQMNQIVSGLRVVIDDELVTVVFDECPQLQVKVIDVLLGPFNL